jgi:hypothetical protein
MPHVRRFVQKFITVGAVVLFSLTAPLGTALMIPVAHADDSCAPTSSGPGVTRPTGSDAGTYTYQCTGANAGKWTNPYYVYDPATGSTSPLYSPDYEYDCTTGQWTKALWDYSPASGQFYEARVNTGAPAGVPTNCPVATPVQDNPAAAAPDGTPGTGNTPAADSIGGTGGTAGANNTSGLTGPNGTSTGNLNLNNNLNIGNTTNASMNNTITGVSTTGSALVMDNTVAGSASSGNAQDVANIVNMLQSSSNVLGSGANTIVFTKNIDGDVNGDLLLDPAQLSTIQNASSNTNVNNNLTVNNSTNASINNTVNVAANSGDATVANNTTGGDASTGNATAVANLVNVINSALTAGKSFVGTLNINGNLNGDILLPDNFIDQLVAANVPQVTISAPNATSTSSTTVNNNATVTNTNNMGITNNVTTTAASGSANVSNNTTAGNASTGNATTKITAFNLTGSQVVGANDILVFVNVQGNWIGMIVNAPAGSTAAELGGNITKNTTVNNTADINNAFNGTINNDITTAATTGDATVSSNTHGGNATTGDAHSAVNLLNMQNSTLSLSGWLGILFINVFGTWNGSFGINTSAGDPLPANLPPGLTGVTAGSVGNNMMAPAQIFRFVPHTTKPGSSGGGNLGKSPHFFTASALTGNGAANGTHSTSASPSDAVLAASTVKSAADAPSPALSGHKSHTARTLGIVAASILFYTLWEATAKRREHRKSQA